MTIKEILKSGDVKKKRALFLFNDKTDKEKVILKFNIWARYYFPRYFSSKDAPFHKKMDKNLVDLYFSKIHEFKNGAFRGAAKTARTKLFLTFAIANDENKTRRYIKIVSAEWDNSAQIVTDIYNALNRMNFLYPEIFEKTIEKREERMSSFTTSTGIKVVSSSVAKNQRGALQEANRPDFVWFEDFENRKTLRSAVTTQAIWDNMEELRTGLSINGVTLYTFNYISEMGNVHKLVETKSPNSVLSLIPIKDEKGKSMWADRYSERDIKEMENRDDDFEGERMCKPSANKDVYFDRETLDRMEIKQPIRVIAGFKIFQEYNPSHRYAGGNDVAGGVGLDSSTSVFIDFSVVPAQVVGTFHSNTILPEAFGDEIYNEGNIFGGCLLAPENNKFDQTVLKAKLLGANLYMSRSSDLRVGESKPTSYGWNTNSLTKSKMLGDLKAAIVNGWIQLNDEELINEAKSYTRNDLINKDVDIRLTTRHFDLLMALAIAWQMKDEATIAEPPEEFQMIDLEAEVLYEDIGI